MTDAEKLELERLAKAATPGPWRWGQWWKSFGSWEDFSLSSRETLESGMGGSQAAIQRKREDQPVCVLRTDDEKSVTDMEFIAAANPKAVLELIAELRDLSEALDELTQRPIAERNFKRAEVAEARVKELEVKLYEAIDTMDHAIVSHAEAEERAEKAESCLAIAMEALKGIAHGIKISASDIGGRLYRRVQKEAADALAKVEKEKAP